MLHLQNQQDKNHQRSFQNQPTSVVQPSKKPPSIPPPLPSRSTSTSSSASTSNKMFKSIIDLYQKNPPAAISSNLVAPTRSSPPALPPRNSSSPPSSSSQSSKLSTHPSNDNSLTINIDTRDKALGGCESCYRIESDDWFRLGQPNNSSGSNYHHHNSFASDQSCNSTNESSISSSSIRLSRSSSIISSSTATSQSSLGSCSDNLNINSSFKLNRPSNPSLSSPVFEPHLRCSSSSERPKHHLSSSSLKQLRSKSNVSSNELGYYDENKDEGQERRESYSVELGSKRSTAMDRLSSIERRSSSNPLRSNPPPLPPRRRNRFQSFPSPSKSTNDLKLGDNTPNFTARNRTKDQVLESGPYQNYQSSISSNSNTNDYKELRSIENLWRVILTKNLSADKEGLILTSEDGEELVLNLIVRSIWSRSGLTLDELFIIWDEVDTRRDGRMSFESFKEGIIKINQIRRKRKN